MGFAASTFTYGTAGRGSFSGRIYRITPTFLSSKRIYLPPSCSAIEAKPSVQDYFQRQYLVGQHTVNLLIDENMRALRQGITVPPAPSVSVGAGTTLQRCYLRYYDELTGEKSSVGLGVDVTGNTTRTWTGLPTSVPSEALIVEGTVNIAAGVVTGLLSKTNFGILRPGDRIAVSTALTQWAQIRSITAEDSMTIDDTAMAGAGVSIVVKPVSRVSHVEEWISVSGGLPRFGTRLRLGTAGNVESIATLALGEALVTTYQPMPTGGINLIYNDRQFVAQVQGALSTVYASAIGFPERWEGLAFNTSYGEPIVGLFRYRDVILLLCPHSSYKLQGYTEDDYVRSVLEPDIGALGHRGNMLAEGVALIPGRNGVQTFNGAFHPAIDTRRTEWIQDYRDNPTAFEGGFAAMNPSDMSYMFFPNVQRIAVSSDEVPTVGLSACNETGVGGLKQINPLNRMLYMETWDPITTDKPALYYFSKHQNPRIRYDSTYGVVGERDHVVGSFGDGYLWTAGCTGLTAGNVYLRRMKIGTGAVPVTVATIAYTTTPTPTFPFEVTGIASYLGDIYLVASDSTTTADSRIYKYSGGVLTVDDAGSNATLGSGLRALGNDLYMSKFAGFWRRKTAGAWADFAAPTTFCPQMTIYGTKMYVSFVTGPNIYSLAGTAFTVEHAIAGGNPLNSMGVFNGYLYYLNVGAANQVRLGRYNGVVWDDTHKNIETQFGQVLGVARLIEGSNYFLGECDGDLCLLMFDNASPGCPGVIIRSNGTDTAGTWIMEATHHDSTLGSYTVNNHGVVV